MRDCYPFGYAVSFLLPEQHTDPYSGKKRSTRRTYRQQIKIITYQGKCVIEKNRLLSEEEA